MVDQHLTHVIRRIEKLEKAVFGTGKSKKAKKKKEPILSSDLDFSLNERAFVKRYASDKSGPKKFTILLAYLAKGELDKNVELREIKKLWNRMKSKVLLGGEFNLFYPNDAKNRGWIDSKQRGIYHLTREWKNVL